MFRALKYPGPVHQLHRRRREQAGAATPCLPSHAEPARNGLHGEVLWSFSGSKITGLSTPARGPLQARALRLRERQNCTLALMISIDLDACWRRTSDFW